MSPELLSTSLNSTNTNINDYDYQGAAIYIAIILIWYSTGPVLMLFFRVRKRTYESQFLFDYETFGKSASSPSNPFARYNDIQADNTTKQILNELKDRENRERLWKIYFSLAEKPTASHTQYYQTITADNLTIGRINRKLADIHRMGIRQNSGEDEEDEVRSTSTIQFSNDSRSDISKFFPKRFTARRLSGIPGNIRRPIFRVQSQPQTPLVTSTDEVENIACEKQPSTNGSRKRTNNFLNRFTVEKVFENNRKCSTVKENVPK